MKIAQLKDALRLLALTAATVLVVGCASGGSSSLATKSSAYGTDEAVDAAYVARVETLARHRGVDVHWVNPPRVLDRKVAKR